MSVDDRDGILEDCGGGLVAAFFAAGGVYFKDDTINAFAKAADSSLGNTGLVEAIVLTGVPAAAMLSSFVAGNFILGKVRSLGSRSVGHP